MANSKNGVASATPIIPQLVNGLSSGTHSGPNPSALSAEELARLRAQQTQPAPQPTGQPTGQPATQTQPRTYQYTPVERRQVEYVAPILLTAAQDAYANRTSPYSALASQYEAMARSLYAEQADALKKQMAASKQATSANYDSAASGNYINYMKQKNALGEQLAAQGIRGGASESALTRMGNNYALNQGNTAASRYAALGAIQNTYDTNVANLKQALEERIMDANLALQQSQIQYDDTLAQRAADEARYNADLERSARERYEDMVREDNRYYDDIDRENKLRAEDIAREDERYKAEQERYAKEYKTEQSWKNKEWKRYAQEKKVEEYAAGLTRYVGKSGIERLRKLRENITKKDKKWAKDPVKYGRVQAINARIGAIRAGKA